MTREAIFERLVTLIREQRQDSSLDVTPHLSLKDDLGVDSIELVEFIINIEDDFNIEIPDDEVDNMTSMEDLLDYLQGKLNK